MRMSNFALRHQPSLLEEAQACGHKATKETSTDRSKSYAPFFSPSYHEKGPKNGAAFQTIADRRPAYPTAWTVTVGCAPTPIVR